MSDFNPLPPRPVEVDIAVGIHGERCVFRVETMAHVIPHEFVAQVQGFIESLLWPQASASAGVSTEPVAPNVQGEVVSGEGAATGPGVAAPEPEKPRGRPSRRKPEVVAEETPSERWDRMEQRRKDRIDAALKQRGVA